MSLRFELLSPTVFVVSFTVLPSAQMNILDIRIVPEFIIFCLSAAFVLNSISCVSSTNCMIRLRLCLASWTSFFLEDGQCYRFMGFSFSYVLFSMFFPWRSFAISRQFWFVFDAVIFFQSDWVILYFLKMKKLWRIKCHFSNSCHTLMQFWQVLSCRGYTNWHMSHIMFFLRKLSHLNSIERLPQVTFEVTLPPLECANIKDINK